PTQHTIFPYTTLFRSFRMTGKGPPPRPHYKVFQGEKEIGEVTSGTLSPSLNYGVGMAYLSPETAKIGSTIEIEIRGQKFPAQIRSEEHTSELQSPYDL